MYSLGNLWLQPNKKSLEESVLSETHNIIIMVNHDVRLTTAEFTDLHNILYNSSLHRTSSNGLSCIVNTWHIISTFGLENFSDSSSISPSDSVSSKDDMFTTSLKLLDTNNVAANQDYTESSKWLNILAKKSSEYMVTPTFLLRNIWLLTVSIRTQDWILLRIPKN